MRLIASHDRPREKLARAGADTLGDNELVAIVLGTGMRGQSALDMANAVLTQAGGVRGLARMTHDELAQLTGVGAARAARVLASVEIGRRALTPGAGDRMQFVSPHDIAQYLLPLYGSHGVERFGVVLLDTRYRLIRSRILSVGSLDASVADPRELFREAMAAGAAGVVLFHNHPSGDPSPSSDDFVLTRRFVRAGDILNIEVVDHIVLGDDRYYSMRVYGRL